MRVGIVCEGVHDFPTLSALVSDLAKSAGVTEVVCLPLQPAPDASSRKSGDGGWPKVVAWCKANSGRGLDTYFQAPLFDGEVVFDAIVIHLDGDIASVCAQQFGVPLSLNPTVTERVEVLSNLILSWIDPPENYKNKIKSAVPTQKTETWVLAALSSENHDWESVESKAILLDETGFVEGRPGKANHYRYLAGRLVGLGDLIRHRCQSFELFAAQLP